MIIRCFVLSVALISSVFLGADQQNSPSLVGKDNTTSTAGQLEVNQGGQFTRSLTARPPTLTPFLTLISESERIKKYIFESLLRQDPSTGEMEGSLAKSWSVSEDGLTYTFQLNKNVVFSDGESFDASDVLFTYNFLMNKKMDIPGGSGFLKTIESVTAPNPYEVVFKYAEPYFRSLKLAGFLPILPEHYYKEYLDDPAKFRSSKTLVLGTGPYQLDREASSNLTGSQVVLKKNPRYWGESKGTFDKLVWKVIDNSSARLVAFRNGELDTIEVDPKVFAVLKNDKDILAKSNVFEFMKARQGYTYIGWNAVSNGKETFFADKRVRLAMTYLTDKRKIVDQVYKGFAEVADSPFSKRGEQHNKAIKPYEYNVAKAKAILEDVGFKDRDGDGVIEDKSGKPFSFKFTYASEREDSRLVALMLRDAYARAGINMTLDPQLSSRLYDMMDEKSYEALTSGWSGGLELDIYFMFHSDEIKGSLYNFISYRNDQLDALINTTRKTVDASERMALWRRVHQVLHDDQPYTFLVHRKSLQLVNKRLRNVKVTQSGLNLMSLPLEIYVPKSEQKH
ncbi:ABC transporter substrate-binding protein [Leucothrix arctica]|uniref:ABC transporter substrate-binding protein n=1 Tax=Leucothrix arctica TaxID=1481894 RepID=A0A317CLG0_9GAMM|nr:ABC transporter substrate-binding protein [Leucothrix arctica]PWQ99434.1 ABC transporter substrate-binding protein [Leucothrix arctica]